MVTATRNRAVLLGGGLILSLALVAVNGRVLKTKPPNYEMVPADDRLDVSDDDSLFYAGDDELLSTEAPSGSSAIHPSTTSLGRLMQNILKNAGNASAADEQCRKHRSKIHDLCLEKYSQRSRLYLGSTGSLDDDIDLDSIPSPQQICCEFRWTYLRCLISNINLICPPSDFNAIYDQVRGLSEICYYFFNKSSKKCRRRYAITVTVQNPNFPEFNMTSI